MTAPSSRQYAISPRATGLSACQRATRRTPFNQLALANSSWQNHRDQNMHRFHQLSLFAACILVLVSPVASSAQTIIDEWSSVKAPPAPELRDATIAPKTTALLMLDFVKQNCNEKVRPRCPATLPAAKQLLA